MSLEWKDVVLKDVLSKKGYIRGPFGSALKRAEMKSEGIPVYEQQNAIYDNRIFRYYIDEEKYQSLKRFTTYPDDLIISCSGTVGKVSIIKKNDPKGIISQALLTLRVNKDLILPEFLKYFFSSYEGYNSLVSRSTGSVQVNISKRAVIEEIPLKLPPLDIQQKIVHYLSLIDKKIEINEKINKNLFSIASSIQTDWMINFTPFKSNQFKSSTFGLIPEGWNVGKLGDVIELLDSKRIPLSGQERENMEKIYPYYGAASLMDYVDDYIFDGIYLLIGEDGTVIDDKGFPILQYVWGKFWVNNHAHIVKGKNGFNVDSLYLLLSKTNIQSIVTGAVQAKVNQSNLKSMEIIIPPVEVMENFNELIKPFFDIIRSNNDEIKKLSKLRDTLLPKLMSGEIDVSKINYDLKNKITNFNIIPLNLFNRGVNMKTKIISKIQNQMKPYLNQGQYIKLTNSLLNSLQDIDIIDNNNDLSDVDNFKLLKLFLSAKEVEGCSNKTIVYYKSTIEKMLLKIKKQVYNINTDDLRKYLYDYKYNNKSSKTTIDNIRRIFSSFFAWLEEEDYIIKNPVRRIHRVKTGRVVKETLTDENLEVLRDNCEEIRDLAIVELLVSTGIRVGELVRLNINDVDFYERECIVFGKGESERVVYFDARTKIHLMEYLQSRVDENPALFVSLNDPYNRLGISGVETRLRELGKKCNINKVHPHKFRRTMATNAIDKGMPIEQVQRLLGHLQIDTTMQYAMVNQSNVKLAHRKFIG